MSLTARAILNLLLAAAFVGAVGAGLLLHPNVANPNVDFLPDMAHSPRYNAFASNPTFADGTTLQVPVAGTIARDHMPLRYAATPEDAARAGNELQNPYNTSNANALTRGKYLFTNFCQECHGAQANGMGPVAQRGYPPPPSLLAGRALNIKDGQIFHILTYGQNNMPSYASQLTRDDRWKVIAYVRSLQPRPTATLASAAGGRP